MTNTESINELTEIKKQYIGGTEECSVISEAIDLAIKSLESDWIPCTKVDHPNHSDACEVTIRDTTSIRREIGFYCNGWRREADELPLDVIAWKEPSKPFNPIVKQTVDYKGNWSE
jgi:hypothetical protein